MKLSSTDFKHNGVIPIKFTCQGHDINPTLLITDVPEGAKSLALILDDPDVPSSIRKDCLWVHWIVYNIDPKIRTVKEAASSLGVVGKNTKGEQRYMGPCPPDKMHRYFFKLYALDTLLPVIEGITKEHLASLMSGHILEQAELIGRFQKE